MSTQELGKPNCVSKKIVFITNKVVWEKYLTFSTSQSSPRGAATKRTNLFYVSFYCWRTITIHDRMHVY